MKPKSGALEHSGLKWERVKVQYRTLKVISIVQLFLKLAGIRFNLRLLSTIDMCLVVHACLLYIMRF